ncbi:DUF2061 domain-containing protein [Salegentibacter maritimus]|uniref:DUF2061 domain-containing protein n=1 Tax=Salegentibacter maritimus TaxID=2794347 RepID=UPI0018E4171F|nr:DUF2061 domain-containing protein [Salegentibacter maritimus]MBI6118288.1 DUF2061 domain-containing protein [Salegentibacter maritimus]
MGKSYKRHIAKSITWRVIGTADTILLAWLISGDPLTGLQIGFAEVVTKMVLYYLHERVWFKIRAGITKNGDSKKRHIAKTVTWRIVGTIDTMILAWVISGNPLVGLKVGGAEVITKMILYYFHERGWYKIDYGLKKRRERKRELQEQTANNY